MREIVRQNGESSDSSFQISKSPLLPVIPTCMYHM
ncbi:unnamed protein product [Arabidopsis halleri]